MSSTILITSYYGLKDSLLSAAKAFTKLGFRVIDYQLYRYSKDEHDKKPNYVEDMIELVNTINPIFILWWYIGIPASDLKVIRDKTNTQHVLFNWDDPFDWITNQINEKAQYIDDAFVTCNSSLQRYISAGCKRSHFLLPAYDPEINHIIFDDSMYHDYECDISICCTNLYTDVIYNDQYVNRKILIDNIYENQAKYGYKFYLYGPEWLCNVYPKSYRKRLNHDELNIVFNKSKINICTHVCNTNMYLNERAILILGSGGLLFIDNIDGIRNILSENECVIFNKDDYLDKIVEILKDYDKYYIIRHNGHKKSKAFTYDVWAKRIANNITK